MPGGTNRLLLIILAIFLPPIAVLLRTGLSMALLLNILLCLLFFLPGLVHALWVVTRP